MAKYREVPCKYYMALGECRKGRDACHKGYCQHCGKYEPRAKVRRINRKKQYNEKRRAGESIHFILHSLDTVLTDRWKSYFGSFARFVFTNTLE